MGFTLASGGDEEIRTLDPLLAGQVLSQLSYTPKGYIFCFRRTLKIEQRSLRLFKKLSFVLCVVSNAVFFSTLILHKVYLTLGYLQERRTFVLRELSP